jgi:hypothetical protein
MAGAFTPPDPNAGRISAQGMSDQLRLHPERGQAVQTIYTRVVTSLTSAAA